MEATLSRTQARELTLRDRLSRLTFQQACKLLGPQGPAMIRAGGAWEIDLERDVHVGDDLFRLSLDGAVVTITSMAEADQRLFWNCTRCEGVCEHVGACLSLILEEKTALGLAAVRVPRPPVESLGEAELVRTAVEERAERARTDKMSIKPDDPTKLWTDYLVSSRESGKTYRVALRGWEPGDSFCTCPDYRKNTLGLCKHVLKVQNHATARFAAPERRKAYRQKGLSVHLRYGADVELRLAAPPEVEEPVEKLIRPLRDRPIASVHDLLERVAALAALGHDVTIYPDAEEHIGRVLTAERLANAVRRIRDDPRGHPLRKELLKVELLPYQLDGIAFAVGAGRAILADDMGLGKTIQGIGAAELLAREAGISRVLVVCPASVKSQWASEVRRFCERPCQIVQGGAAERVAQYRDGCFFTICNYEQVLRDILAIEQVRWDLIILDEGQRIKNWEVKTARVVKGLRSPFALVLSGTPLENRLDDLYSVIEFVDDRRLGPAFRFFNRHRVADEKGKVLGYKNLAELRERLAPVLLRRTRPQVMRDLPPRTTEIIRITPTDEQAGLHHANKCIVRQIVRKPYISEMDLLRLRKALLMCRMSADSTYLVDKREPAYSSKLTALDELLESFLAEPARKAVLFSEWTTMLDLIEPLLERRGVKYVRLDGSVPTVKRQPLVNTFRENADCRLFITTNAGATGLNLQAADTVINVDLPWNPAVLEQRVGRAHRMGQKNPVQVFILITEQTIEESLLNTLSAKHELAQAALDVESDVDKVDLVSGMEELKARLEVLLGARPDAPPDESEHARQTVEAERLARREQVALAGGQLLSAAFSFLGQLMPKQGSGNGSGNESERRGATGRDHPRAPVGLPGARRAGPAQADRHVVGCGGARPIGKFAGGAVCRRCERVDALVSSCLSPALRDGVTPIGYATVMEALRSSGTAMNNWPHLRNAPAVEGLIDIRVERSAVVTVDALRTACDEMAADFPSREELSTFTGQFSFSPDGPSVSAQAPLPIGFMLRSADQRWAAQFRLDGFALSRLQPYTSWEELRTRAMGLWAKYRTVAQPQKIVRVASRFINRIPLPPGESFEKTFTTTFSIAASLPQKVAGFLLRIVIPFENEQALAIVTQALPDSPECIFDIDAFAVSPDGISESAAWAKLEQLRGVKNRLFFESLTPQAVERFR